MNSNPRLPYLLIAPSAAFLALLFLWPLVETVLMAFITPEGVATTEYLRKMAGDLNFGVAMRNTLILVAIVVPLQVGIALAMAVMLQKVERGRMTHLYIWTIPLGISDLAAGIVWLAILTDRGYLNSLLQAVGLLDGPTTWLSIQAPVALFACVIVAEIWRATAIVLVILVAGVQLIPKEYDEAAEVFGAGPWKRFFQITLPLLKPSLQSALILRTVLAFEVFAVVYALAGRDLPVLVGEAYNWQAQYQNTHVASAYALLILAVSIASTLIYLRVLRVRKETLA
ncbi:carbohydrate ABC transporter permease [Sphaerotilus mobilis]|uniref:Carbohydrate ABC transporter membrane protein 1 (CUT1 family) n=1 Tax=Sphaerotilus mobilis TaxID=47994 RepID=A0A4Q7LWQ9_9BURK|nr:sugar ABC transporter permease [Sphaerotilus mobilis]RZS58249.1 carbohydrate ABC transporter membrane protein 1 (CUT1 family) [Sphaerotilus mobilis]